MFVLEARPKPAQIMVYLAPIIAIVLTILGGLILFYIIGQDGIVALKTFFIEPLMTKRGISELFLKATPLVLIAVGISFGFRAGVWNIGAEGQFVIGAVCGGMVALYFYDVDKFYVMPFMLLAGSVGGILWAAIPAYFRVRFNTNEILTSLMLVYVAVLLLSVLIHGPLKDPDGMSFPESKLFHDAASLSRIFGTRLHVGSIFTIGFVFVAWIFLSKHLLGFQFKVMGQAPKASIFAGVRPSRMVWLSFIIGGGSAGLAGIFEIAGPLGQIVHLFPLVMVLPLLLLLFLADCILLGYC